MTKTSIRKAALVGVVVGLLYSILRPIVLGEPWPQETVAAWIGYLFGSAVGGAALFAAMAWLRNLLIR